VGTLTPEGRLILLGRLDDCFKTSGGYLVSPAQVANALRAHPRVLDSVVVPVPLGGAAVIGVLVAARVASASPTSARSPGARFRRGYSPPSWRYAARSPR